MFSLAEIKTAGQVLQKEENAQAAVHIDSALEKLTLAPAEGVYREKIQKTNLAIRAANGFIREFKGIVDIERPQYRLIDLEVRLKAVPEEAKSEYLAVLRKHFDGLRAKVKESKGIMQNVYFGFVGGEKYGLRSDSIPGSPDVQFVFEGDANSFNKEKIQNTWQAFFQSQGRTWNSENTFGVSPLNIQVSSGKDVLVFPDEAATVLNVLLQRINMGKAKGNGIDILQIRQGLDQLMRMLVDRINGAQNLETNDIKALQAYQQGFKYAQLAVQALERLNIGQFVHYTALVLETVGSAA